MGEKDFENRPGGLRRLAADLGRSLEFLAQPAVLAIVLLYEAATLGTMLLLVLPARAGARRLEAPFLQRYGDAAAGGVIGGIGLVVTILGI